MIISLPFLLRTRNVSDKILEKTKTRIICSVPFLFPKNRSVYEIMWKNNVGRGRATYDNITQRMLFACWISKATGTHSGYVILIALVLQQWLRERAAVLYLHCLCCINLWRLIWVSCDVERILGRGAPARNIFGIRKSMVRLSPHLSWWHILVCFLICNRR